MPCNLKNSIFPAHAREQDIPRRPTRKEIDLFYKTHRSHFYAGQRVLFLQINKNVDEATDRKTARAIMKAAEEALQKGANFTEVAEQYSDCANGGELGWFTRGVDVPPKSAHLPN